MQFKQVVGGVVAAFVLAACVPGDADDRSDAPTISAPSLSPSPAEPTTEAQQPTESASSPEASETPIDPAGDTTEAEQTSSGHTAVAALALLTVKGRAPMTGYDRARFGQAWLDADRNGCDTRNDVLAEHLTDLVLESNGCVVATGRYDDPYTGANIDYRHGDGTLIDIDHVVALGNAWVTGALRWHIKKRAAFSNDPLNLLPADAGANRQKADGDAATWLPAYKPFRCEYVARQVAVKQKYGLWVTPAEKQAIARVLSACPEQVLPKDRWAAPTRVDHDITDPGPPVDKSVEEPSAAPSSPPPAKTFTSTRFKNCDAARAAGAAPVRRGDPGYGSHLDRDGDGVGCE